MAYCILENLMSKLPADELEQLCWDGRAADYPDETALQDAIAEAIDQAVASAIDEAAAEIDGWCGERYPVPLSPVPEIITKLAVDMAIYNLYARRQGPPEHRQTRYEHAVKLLKAVSQGNVTLGAQAPVETAVDVAQISSAARVFSRRSLKGF